ncbi:MAG: T9SS type A sorting domain-containing protein [Bacteroidetes bacterium]|nr:T9SS type A sorting domain-containing protein [Bacteroidota bacterium]
MKKIFQIAVVLAFLPAFTNAQITIQADEVNPLGVFAIQSRDTSIEASISPGGTGMQTWDFSMLDNDSSDSLAFYPADETAYFSLFPNANLATTLDSIAIIYLEKTNDHIATFGTYGTFTIEPYTVTTAFKYDPPQTIIKFPLELNQTYSETVIGTAQVKGSEVGFPLDSVRSITTTNRNVVVDGYGTLTSPIGTFDVLRSTEVEVSYDSIVYLNNGIWTFLSKTTPKTITYHNWWTNQFNLSFPVVQYKISPGIDTSMIWLNEFVSATHNSKTFLDVKISPNPTSNFLQVDLPEGFVGQMEIFDMLGHRMLVQPAVSATESINVQALTAGTFILVLKDKRGKVAGFERFEILR